MYLEAQSDLKDLRAELQSDTKDLRLDVSNFRFAALTAPATWLSVSCSYSSNVLPLAPPPSASSKLNWRPS